jgi:hypothetical protein
MVKRRTCPLPCSTLFILLSDGISGANTEGKLQPAKQSNAAPEQTSKGLLSASSPTGHRYSTLGRAANQSNMT